MTAVQAMAPARPDTSWAVRPPRVDLRRVFLTCGLVLAAEIPLMLVMGNTWDEAMLPGYAILMVTFGAVFCFAAVTVAGFTAGAAAAGLLVLGVVDLLPVLGGAAVLALVCGVAPGWARVEAWQAARSVALTAGEEAAVARTALPLTGRHRMKGPRQRLVWRLDRAFAAFLVLGFPPAIAAFSLWFIGWVAAR
ncbi:MULTISPECIES: hypothetical protein [unclassified Geodermatophilus]|uniref:hypothetical protein n=1 Tax=unclassified Geodermatophilus TaxID=2637632 RepID=UPI003EEFB466